MRKPIKDFPGYFICDDGRVYSTKTKDLPPGSRGRFLKCSPIKGHGYTKVCLIRPGDKIRHVAYVHRLVAQAFIENPENKPQVNHKNFNRADNRKGNLEWCTPGENICHSRNSKRKGG